MKEFGEHFRKIRRSQKFTQKSLAHEADIEISQISRLENGITNPTVTTILILAKAMKIPASVLFDYKKSSGKK